MLKKISKFPHKRLRHYTAFPFIFGMAVPIAALDITLEVFHRVTFPLCGIPLNKRSNYIRIDQQKLQYLNSLDKLSCMYCGYGNGVAAYFVKIAGDTEAYWCGVKHQTGGGFVEQPHQKDFLEYGDEEAFNNFITKK